MQKAVHLVNHLRKSNFLIVLSRKMSKIVNEKVAIRGATIADLPSIHQLIRESFEALNDFHPTNQIIKAFTESNIKDVVDHELQDGPFQQMYFSSPDNYFWVAEHTEQGIVGCVAIKRFNNEESELVRMAVSKSCRSGGIGGLLINELFSFCVDHRIMRIFLTTANHLSSKFYIKNGFVTTASFPWTMHGADFRVFKMSKYLGEKILRHVTVVGGTHGNERIGEWYRRNAIVYVSVSDIGTYYWCTC